MTATGQMSDEFGQGLGRLRCVLKEIGGAVLLGGSVRCVAASSTGGVVIAGSYRSRPRKYWTICGVVANPCRR